MILGGEVMETSKKVVLEAVQKVEVLDWKIQFRNNNIYIYYFNWMAHIIPTMLSDELKKMKITLDK